MATSSDILKNDEIICVDDDKNTKLHYAAVLGNVEEIKKIVAVGEEIDPENYLGWTPLMMAVRVGNTEVVQLLLQSGADPTKKNKFDINLLLLAVASGVFYNMMQILQNLTSGCRISKQSLQKVLSPLSVALLYRQEDIFRVLLTNSFDPDAATPFTNLTPMMFAAALGNSRAIHYLLKYNANPRIRNLIGKQACDIAQIRHKIIDLVARKRDEQFPIVFKNHSGLQTPTQTPDVNEEPPMQNFSDVDKPLMMPFSNSPPRIFIVSAIPPVYYKSPGLIDYDTTLFNHNLPNCLPDYFSPPEVWSNNE